MSFKSLLTSRSAIQRRFNTGRNEFFEAVVDYQTIARNVPHRREHVGRDTLDMYGIPAEIGKSRHIFYYLPRTDIQLGDRILVTHVPKSRAQVKAELAELCESYSSSDSSSSSELLETSSETSSSSSSISSSSSSTSISESSSSSSSESLSVELINSTSSLSSVLGTSVNSSSSAINDVIFTQTAFTGCEFSEDFETPEISSNHFEPIRNSYTFPEGDGEYVQIVDPPTGDLFLFSPFLDGFETTSHYLFSNPGTTVKFCPPPGKHFTRVGGTIGDGNFTPNQLEFKAYDENDNLLTGGDVSAFPGSYGLTLPDFSGFIANSGVTIAYVTISFGAVGSIVLDNLCWDIVDADGGSLTTSSSIEFSSYTSSSHDSTASTFALPTSESDSSSSTFVSLTSESSDSTVSLTSNSSDSTSTIGQDTSNSSSSTTSSTAISFTSSTELGDTSSSISSSSSVSSSSFSSSTSLSSSSTDALFSSSSSSSMSSSSTEVRSTSSMSSSSFELFELDRYYTVIHVDDAVSQGHHLEILCEMTQEIIQFRDQAFILLQKYHPQWDQNFLVLKVHHRQNY